MYTIDDLNVKLLSELKDLAEGMGVKNARKLGKQELIYKILDEQAKAPDTQPKKSEGERLALEISCIDEPDIGL